MGSFLRCSAVLMVLATIAVSGGCRPSDHVAAPTSANPSSGDVVKRGPYTFRLDSVQPLPPDAGPGDPRTGEGPIVSVDHYGVSTTLAAEPGTRFLIVRIATSGEIDDQLQLYGKGGTPRVLLGGARKEYPVHQGKMSRAADGLLLWSWTFQIPDSAGTALVTFNPQASGGPVSFRLR